VSHSAIAKTVIFYSCFYLFFRPQILDVREPISAKLCHAHCAACSHRCTRRGAPRARKSSGKLTIREDRRSLETFLVLFLMHFLIPFTITNNIIISYLTSSVGEQTAVLEVGRYGTYIHFIPIHFANIILIYVTHSMMQTI